jgi:hypothetical protein
MTTCRRFGLLSGGSRGGSRARMTQPWNRSRLPLGDWNPTVADSRVS